MSELREWTASEIEEYDDARLELAESDEIDCTRVYIKSDADKVIAEKDKVIEELKESVKNLILDNYLKDKELRHNKYKRCLAMATMCHWKMGVFIYKKEKSDFYYRWHKRWMELAEKFKEAK